MTNVFKKEGAWVYEYSGGGLCQASYKIIGRNAKQTGFYTVVTDSIYRQMQRAASDAKYAELLYSNAKRLPLNEVQHA